MNQKTMWYTVLQGQAGEEHLDTSMKVLFVLDGTMTVRCQDESTALKKEDIYHINPGLSWEIVRADHVLYGEAVYAVPFLSTLLGSDTVMFYCNSAADDTHSYQDLRDLFYRLTAEYTARTRSTDLLLDTLLLALLDTMAEHYRIDEGKLAGAESETDSRMREIMQYIVSNLDKEISLSSLADEMYVSTSTLSRIFKKSTGVYFADYVSRLRVQAAVPQLAFSDQSLTQIALGCGFTNSAGFSRTFRKYMGMTPTEYREQHRKEAARVREEEKKKEDTIREQLRKMGYEKVREGTTEQIRIDAGMENAPSLNRNWNEIINIGALYDLTRANIQFHVTYLQEQLHFSRVRVWNVFSQRLLFTDGKSMGLYNYDLMDQALDFLVQHKLKPFLDFGRRPDTAIRSDGQRIFYNEDYIPFAGFEQWQSAVTAFLRHITVRYGLEEVSSWYYELTYYSVAEKSETAYYGGNFRFLDAFEYLHRQMRALIPGALLGGSGAVIAAEWEMQNRFAQGCIQRGCIPDFLSFKLFPVDDARLERDLPGKRPLSEDASEEMQIAAMRELLETSGLAGRGTKLWITEWNNSISNRNYLNDSCFRAAYLVHKLSKISGLVDKIAVMAGSDWISSYMDTVGILNGGIGILSKDTIRKPAFYALEFLNDLGDRVLANGEHLLATRDESGGIWILCSYYSWFRRSHVLGSGDMDLSTCRNMTFEDEKPLKLEIDLMHPGKPGTWSIKKQILNADHGSILDAWADFGCSTELSRGDIKYLAAVSVPALSEEKRLLHAPGETLHLSVTMQPQELTLLHLYRQD